MSSPVDPLTVIVSIAEQQCGLVTTAQAVKQGVTRLQISRLAERRILTRVEQGLYALAGSEETHRELRAVAGAQ